MSTLKIPDRHLSTINLYTNLPIEVKNIILSEIKNSSIGTTPDSFANYLSEKIPIHKNDLIDILSVLYNLQYTQKKMSDISDDDFFLVLKESLQNSDVKFENIDRTILDLKQFLGTRGENVTATLNVIDIMNDFPKLFMESNINTDIRPVFIENDNNVKGFLIIHSLKITFQQNNETKEDFLAMDSNDLARLKAQIELAELRLEEIKKLNLNIIDIK